MAEVEDRLLDHNYDGIEEFDNPLPQWWLTLFILCVIFGGIYMFYYHIAEIGDLQLQEYANEFPKEDEQQKAPEEFQKGEMFAANIDDKDMLAKGEKVYQANCASCHKADGGGSVGPNLTDEYWIHGGSFTDIVWTVVEGVPEKGMLSWRKILSKEDIIATANFIRTLRGTNPAGGKAPQGDLWDGTEKLPEAKEEVKEEPKTEETPQS